LNTDLEILERQRSRVEDRATQLAERLVRGDRTALARVISAIENESAEAPYYLDRIHAKRSESFRVGVTGPPGVGKSVLVNSLAVLMRKDDRRVGIIAVDPTSPFTGGAILGDRIRMGDIAMDDGVFMRSMATRGSTGGLATATLEVCEALEAFGSERIILETVGVGQSELDVVEVVDATIVVLVPELGDSVQMMKAGLMEAADIFVVNKCDHPGSEQMVNEINSMLEFRDRKEGRVPPVMKTVATRGEGTQELYRELENTYDFLSSEGILTERRKKVVRQHLKKLMKEELWDRFSSVWKLDEKVDEWTEEVVKGIVSPYKLLNDVRAKLKDFLKGD